MRIDRPAELTAVLSAAVVRERAHELAGRGNKELQRYICARAGGFDAKSSFRRVVFGACDRNGVIRAAAHSGIAEKSAREIAFAP